MAKIKRLWAMAWLCMLVFQKQAWAGLDEEMSGMFSEMLNTTPSGYYETQRRGVIAGGSVYSRNKILNPRLLSFVPPHIKSGCGGIDMYMGSFSFVNSEQLTQLLRAVSQNAMGYAFQLAIEGMCPTCAQVMTKLQKDIAHINQIMKNSCETAKQLVNGSGFKAWKDKQDFDIAGNAVTDWYLKNDFFAAKENGQEPVSLAVNAGKKEEVTKNVVHDVVKDSSVYLWFTHGDEQLGRALMSLTGTVIANVQTQGGKSNAVYEYRRPTLEVNDLMRGGSVKIYKCANRECLLDDGNPTETVQIEGMRTKVTKMLFGSGVCQFCTGGIVRKLGNRENNDEFSENEKKFIESTNPGVLSMLHGIASEPGAVALLGERMVGVVASELTNHLVEAMFTAVQSSVSVTGKPFDSKMMELMEQRRQEIEALRRLNAEETQAVANILAMQETVANALRRKTPKLAEDGDAQ